MFDNGLMTGTSANPMLFSPGDDITRRDLAVILWRYAKYAGSDVSVGEDTNVLSFGDAFNLAEYAISTMQWVYGAGLVTGGQVGLLDPPGTASRAETAALLQRFLEV